MVWAITLAVSLIVALVLVPLRKWKGLWPVSLITMGVHYGVDTTLIALGAFSYSYGSKILSGMPILYWLGDIPIGILFAYYFPKRREQQLMYIVVAAIALVVLEVLMLALGYFHHYKWSLMKSLFLNLGGLMAIAWLAQWVGVIQKKR